jgi:gamma-glutamyl-gamma-aminobutyrate hydrolase PuuD
MKVYVVGGDTNYVNFLQNVSLVDNVEEAELIVFTGGEDVDPSLYNCKKSYKTYSNLNRDLYEKEIFDKIRPDQKCLGICRGSQFLCVMNGGRLVQHCINHAGRTHSIINPNQEYEFIVTSTHHQMQYPFNLPSSDYTILYKALGFLSNIYEGDQINTDLIYENGEPEIVKYHKKGKPVCLAVQGHPEFIPNSQFATLVNTLIDQL